MSYSVRRVGALWMMIFSLATIAAAQPLFLGQVSQAVLLHLRIAASGSAVVATGWSPIARGKNITWLCQPISVIVNDRFAPKGAVVDLKQALMMLSHASGVTWKYVGRTHKLPGANHLVGAPVLISWQHGGAKNALGEVMVDPAVSGTAGPFYSQDGSHWSSGVVTLNADKDYLYTPGFGVGRTRGALLLHELGHVAGLGHVKNPKEMMAEHSEFLSRPASYGSGDKAGLRALFPGCGGKGLGGSYPG
jgi:hypothetical protein